MSDSPEEVLIAPVEYRLICGICYAILSIIGLCAHTFIILLFFQRRRTLLRTAFYVLALHMCFCDWVSLLVQLIVAVPLTLTAQNVYKDMNVLFIYSITNFTDTVIFNSLMILTFWMAVNRLTVFWSKRLNSWLFGRKGLFILIPLTYLYCLADTSTRQFFGCTKNFSTDGFYFFHTCVTAVGQGILNFNGGQNTGLPAAMFVIYLGLFLYLRTYLKIVDKSSSDAFREKRNVEFSLLIQGSIICFFLELQTLSFMLFSKIPVSGMGSFYLTFLQNIISILNNCVSPAIYFTCNKDIRSYAFEFWLYCKGERLEITTINFRLSIENSRRNSKVVSSMIQY